MSAATLPSAPAPARNAGRVVAIIVGALMALLAFGLLVAGGTGLWADTTQRDAGGWLSSPWHRFDTPTRALTAEGLRLGDIPGDWIPEFGDVRIRARRADGGPVFVGLAPERRVDAYLAGVAHTEVDGVHRHGYDGTVRRGARVPAAPATANGWSVAASGQGTQAVRWDPQSGSWAAVVMNASGGAGVRADIQVGLRADWLLPLSLALLGAGLAFALAATGLIAYGATNITGPGPFMYEAAAATPEPVTVTARLDEPLSRWLWLVKCVLAIPHYVILVFLWPAFIVVTLAALVAIVFTGRYPRGLFDFNVGVLRWSWRVGFYVCYAFATDRYPPFTLARTDYPAELDIAYPERLSRWKALLKPWLLAIPHYLVLTAFFGSWTAVEGLTFPGLLPVLVVIAVVVLAVRGRYPRDIFSLVVGINRWALRVAAYAGLMRDEYPPFRLDR